MRIDGLQLKAKAISGQLDETKLVKLGTAALGVEWSTKTTYLTIRFRINTTLIKCLVLTVPDLCPETLGDWNKSTLNKKLCLGITNMQYVPLSHNTQITICLKTAVKDLFHQK